METTPTTAPAHTTDDLIDIFGDLLMYVRADADVHRHEDHDEDDESCPIKLYVRGRDIYYEDAKLFRLLRAAPKLLKALKHAEDRLNSIRHSYKHTDFRMIRDAIEQAEA